MRRPPATIVVLEENAAAQELMDRTLSTSGDRVLISNSPMEALGLSSRVRIDLLVVDVGLLERSDPTVVEKLRSVGRVLYTNVADSSRLAQKNSGAALRSPFSLEELREAVAAALDDHR
jgi:DNA-binding response OmpR family regulator